MARKKIEITKAIASNASLPPTKNVIPVSPPGNVYGFNEKFDPYSNVGWPGFKFAYPGYILDEQLPELTGKKAINVYREMGETDPICHALIYIVRMFFRSSTWYVAENSEEEPDMEAAEFLDGCMNDMTDSWQEFLAEVSSMAQYGHSVFEITYKKRNGKLKGNEKESSKFDDGNIGWQSISPRAQETIWHWVFAPDSADILGLVQLSPPYYRLTFIPNEKLLLFKTEPNRANPEGRSLLRPAYTAWYTRKKLNEIRCIGADRGVAGIPMLWLPPNITNPDPADDAAKSALRAYEQMAQEIRIDSRAAIIMPLAYDENGNKLYDIELLTTDGYHTEGISEIVQEKSMEILQSAMAEFSALGTKSVGSFALSSDKTNNFIKAISTFLDVVEAVLNNKAVPRLFELNPKFKVEKLPQLKHKPLQDIDLNTIANMIKALAPAGMDLFPDLKVENVLREAMGLPPKSQEEFDSHQKKIEEEEQMQMQQMQQFGQSPDDDQDDQDFGNDDEGPDKDSDDTPGDKKPNPFASKKPKEKEKDKESDDN
jgi:hypothetical protein